jgi:hypothetical protein
MRRLSPALLAVVALASSHPATADTEPDWLVAARAREGKPAPTQRVESSDKAIAFSVPARLIRPITATDGSYLFDLDIGGSLPASCEIFAGDVALASLLGETSENLLNAAKAAQGSKLEASKPDRIDAGVMGDAPFMALDLAYRARTGEEARFGTVKQLAAVRLGHVLYCSHDEVGYVRSLRDVFAAMLSSLVVANPPAPPRYLAVDVVSIGGQPLGLQLARLEADADGDLKMTTSVSLMLGTGDDGMSTSQDMTVQWTRPDGSLLNAFHIGADDDGITTELRLEPEGDRWNVSGTLQGKELAQSLVAAPAPDSLLTSAWAIRDLTRATGSSGRATTQRLWVPGIDPTRLINVTTRIAEPVPPAAVKATQSMGPVTAELVLDRTSGDLVRGSLPIGAQRMEMVRVHVQGEF